MVADKLKNQVQSLAKGFRVLEAFSATDTEMTLSEIGRKIALDPGTVFRMVNTLVSLGYLSKREDSRRYRLTLKILDLGFTAIGHMELRALARPILRSLVGEVSEAASLATLEGPDVIFLERVHVGLVRLGVDVRIGTRIPAYYTALGHAMLAFLPPADQARILNARDRVKLISSTLTDLEDIEARLLKVRTEGFALSEQEMISGLRVIAVPVFDVDGKVTASVSVAAPSRRMPIDDFVDQTVEPLKKAAADIGKAIQISGAASGPVAALHDMILG